METTAKTSGLRIERAEREGRVVWIKRPESARFNIWSALHGAISPLLPAYFRTTRAGGADSPLEREAARLRSFAAQGVTAPLVLEAGAGRLVLSDCGEDLRLLIKHASPERAQALLHDAARFLASAHAAGLAHGRPHIKDFARDPETGALALLDMEEDPCAVMALAQAQARDLWLFLGSAAPCCSDPGTQLPALAAVYEAAAPAEALVAVRRFARLLRPLRRLLGVLGARWMGRDLSGAYWSTLALERAAAPPS